MRRKLLITGAAGGMGRACARLMGLTYDLVLADVAAPALESFAGDLVQEGYTVAGFHSGDLSSDDVLRQIIAHLTGDVPFALVHTAGLSPSMADWRSIMNVNLVATEKLLQSLEQTLVPGSVAVLIASAAGHAAISHPDAPSILADPLAPDFMQKIGPVIDVMTGGAAVHAPGLSYVLSKQAVLSTVERRCIPWGAKGARIVSISPGMILTPMGRKELAETPGAAELSQVTPARRSGRAMDIAMAARFLASDEASFITGSDLKIDGGGIAATRLMAGG